jgi:hypothetical protein
MRTWRIGGLFLLTTLLIGCMGESRRDAPSKASAPVDLNVPAPTTYCEKTWSCSFENLVQDEARRAMVQKRKAFVTACEDALRRMPADLVKKYENCTRVSCGDELRSCLLQQVPKQAPAAAKPE